MNTVSTYLLPEDYLGSGQDLDDMITLALDFYTQ